MAHNSAKGNWTLDELGWTLKAPGDFRNWNGLIRWFLNCTQDRPDLTTDASMRQWRHAATLAMKGILPEPVQTDSGM
jgi:hypothetical protein